jgi:hypothetical protein
MTTTHTHASSACQPDPSSSPPSIAPCGNEATSLLIRPEWVPLDAVAQTWADFAPCASHAHALQAVGTAFLALSFEMSAHTHYTQAYHGLWKLAPSMVAHGVGQAIADLGEACQQWVSAFLWLERFANEERHDAQMLETLRDLFADIREQQQRLWFLLLRLQEEQRSMQGKALFVHLGHLSSTLAPAVEEERRTCP